MIEARDVLGQPVEPGDRLGWAERSTLVVVTVLEVRYLAIQGGSWRPVDQQFATRWNMRVRPIVASRYDVTYEDLSGQKRWATRADAEIEPDRFVPKARTISSDRVGDIVKL
jgi:hypothetical protein